MAGVEQGERMVVASQFYGGSPAEKQKTRKFYLSCRLDE
jgi:hypothetical protein